MKETMQNEKEPIRTTAGKEMRKKPMKEIEKEPKKDIYTISEYMEAAETLFGVKPECVKAAFYSAGKTGAGQVEAIKIVKEFMKREVK